MYGDGLFFSQQFYNFRLHNFHLKFDNSNNKIIEKSVKNNYVIS